MKHRKVMFVIPGFNQLPTNKAYKDTAKILKSEGYFPILVKIPWKNKTLLENTEYFIKEYRKIKSKKKYILGFSFGAMIAFIASTRVQSHGLILCSLSPFFKEDMKRSEIRCATLSKKIKSKQILMMYGALEAKSLIRRVTDAFSHISCSNKFLISISKTEHNIGAKKYLRKIHQAARILS